MSVKSFKFVSPGIFVNEVDNSQLPRLPEEMGPVIIGRAERGPGMVPVKIDSFAEFVETFGEPIAGAKSSDAWRQGNKIGPTYGAFAAQAYLRNGSPITFIRLLGEAHPDASSDDHKAGWKMPQAHGLYVSTDEPFANNSNIRLAAIIYTDSQQAATTPTVTTDGTPESVRIKLHVPILGTGDSGTAANQTLTVKQNAVPAASGTDKIVLKHLPSSDAGAAAADCLEIWFDATTAEDVLDATQSPVRLTIGTGNVSAGGNPAAGELLAQSLAEKIAASVNAVGDRVNLTCSASVNGGDANKHDVLFVSDHVGDGLSGGNVILTITDGDGSAFDSAGVLSAGTDADPGTNTEKTFTVSFDPNSKTYIRDILNTNPTLTNTDITSSSEKYFLGQTFEQSISGMGTIQSAEMKKISGTAFSSYIGDAAAPATPWLYSQYTGSPDALVTRGTNLGTADLAKLFRFHSLYAGEWEQQNFKISITDISASSNNLDKYGRFTVEVRDVKDHDSAPVVYERFSNVNLDPSSPRFIGAVIGDQRMVWRESERRYIHEGSFMNQSRFIRVELAADVESGAANAELLPFAFKLPLHATPLASGASDSALVPKFRLRSTTVGDVKLSSGKSAYFGLSTNKPTNVSSFDESYQDIVRRIGHADDLRASEGGSLFSLDLIVKTGTNGADATFTADAATDAMRARTSLNGLTGNTEGFANVLSSGYDKFTLPLCGGFDGLDITEIEPFCDDRLLGKTSQTHYAFNSLTKAIDMVSDPEVVECNLMAIPGVSAPGITNKLIETCENRGDALAVIDLQNDYVPAGWNTSVENVRLPSVDLAVSSLKSRNMNSSYGCAFFPWVQVSDPVSSRLVWMPPSVVALGTMASSAANSELWFAPAGFTRGGLSAGAGGLPVVQTRVRLNSKDRDKLYEANINPIAQFPAEGIVIFGQKTLQVTPSALDRINVRRLMVHVKKEISRMAATTLFDQNVRSTWNRFLNRAEPFLASVKSRFGLSEYKIVLDETTTTPELVDRNIMYAKIFLKPARAIEFIAIDFVITNTGASFED